MTSPKNYCVVVCQEDSSPCMRVWGPMTREAAIKFCVWFNTRHDDDLDYAVVRELDDPEE